jgi:hypothetical protein
MQEGDTPGIRPSEDELFLVHDYGEEMSGIPKKHVGPLNRSVSEK